MTNWYDLSWNFAPGMAIPEWPGQKNQEFTMTSFQTENTGAIRISSALRTHVDAPGHYYRLARPHSETHGDRRELEVSSHLGGR
jgi:kynurenine formamidase